MHNAAFEALGMDWRYEAIEVEPARFGTVVGELSRGGFAGANVTIPHKLRALEVADSISTIASAVGAANTLTFSGGLIAADNTDVPGLLAALREAVPGAPAGMTALVLGAGGAARAAAYALLSEGAARISVWNRHPQRALALVRDLAAAAGETRLEPAGEPGLAGVDLMVNATAVGMGSDRDSDAGLMRDFKELRLSADDLHEQLVMVDLVYRDGGTALVREARARGLRCVDGFDVLVHQGAASFELWTGRPAPLEAMRNGARKRD
jgi:shikimate dehydrogenase